MAKPKYQHRHQQIRKQYAAAIATDGGFTCWRCRRWFPLGTLWDLGHIDGTDQYAGPECRPCNRGTAAARGNKMRAGKRRRLAL